MKKMILLLALVLTMGLSLMSVQSSAQGNKSADQGAAQNNTPQLQDVETQQGRWSRDCTNEQIGCVMVYFARLAKDTKQTVASILIGKFKTDDMKIRFGAVLGVRVDNPLQIKVDQGKDYAINFLVCSATDGCVTGLTNLPKPLANAMKKGRVMHFSFLLPPGTVPYRVTIPLIGFSAIYNTL